jgi:hypothetical protein
MNAKNVPSRSIAPSGQARSPKKQSKPPQQQPSPEQMDRFSSETDLAQQANLQKEHEAQLATQQSLSQGRIAAMWAQLATSLFAIWNEVWLQRQKSHDESFKAWLKLLSA